jgi:O-antigen/teichoic acid export membrane protein
MRDLHWSRAEGEELRPLPVVEHDKIVSGLNQTVIHGLRWVTMSRLLGQALTWVITLLVIRILSPTDFGLATLAGLFANFLLLLNELGLSTTVIRWQIREEETLRQVFGALLLVGLLLMGALMITAPWLGVVTREPRVVPLIRFISIQFMTMPFAVLPQARLSIDLRFKQLGLADLAASVLGAATTLVLALGNAGAWSIAAGIVMVSASRALFLNLFCFSLRAPSFQISKLRHLARFSGLAILERSLWYWYIQIDSFVVGRYLGAADLGLYGVGKQIASVPLERAMGIINSITLPTFSRIQNEPEQMRRGYLKLLRIGAAYAFPMFWGVALISDPLVRLVFGAKWLGSVIVIQLLCISMPLRMLNSFTSTAVVAINRQDVNIKSLVQAIVVVPLCVLVGLHWGVAGVAAAWAVGFPAIYLFNAVLVQRALQVRMTAMLFAVLPPAGAAAVMSLVTMGMSLLYFNSLPPLLNIMLVVPFAGAVFIAALAVISRTALRETLQLMREFTSRGST